MKTRTFKMLCCCLLLLCTVTAVRSASAGRLLGSKLKNFKVKTVTGESFDLYATLETKAAVIIDLWYTGCPLCTYPLMRLEMSLPRHPDIAAIALDIDGKDKAEDIAWYAESRGYTHTLFARDTGVKGQVRATGFPRMLLVGKGGIILDDDLGEERIEGAMLYAEGLTDADYQNLVECAKKNKKIFADSYTILPFDMLFLTEEENAMPIKAPEYEDTCAPESKLSYTVSGAGLRKISVDENFRLLKAWQKLTQFYILDRTAPGAEDAQVTVEVTLGKGMNPKKAYSGTHSREPFSKAEKNKTTYIFRGTIPRDMYRWDLYPSDNTARDGYAGFMVFESESSAAWYFDHLSRIAGCSFGWHIE